MKSKDVALAALLAALYAVGVTLLSPISFQLFQIRVADMLLPLSILFGLPAVLGLTLGTIVANLSSPFGIIDIGGGTFANFVATYTAWKLARTYRFFGSQFVATLLETVAVTFIVGTYLQYFLQLPDINMLDISVPGIVVSWIGVFLGSVVAINIAGYILLRAVDKVLLRRV